MPDSNIVRLGSSAKIRIFDLVFAVTGGELRFIAQEHDTTTTEADMDDDGTTWEDAETGLVRVEATIEFQHTKLINVHAPPLFLKPGRVIDLKVYADGIDFDPYWFPLFLLTQGSRGLALRSPQNGRVQGRSKGRVLLPGGA